MTKANWKEAPHDAETWEHYRDLYRFCKKDFYFDEWSKSWEHKAFPASWTILEHRPRIIAWEDMKEGMVVRCVDAKGGIYDLDEECEVGTDECGEFGPINNDGCASYEPHRYAFELVSEPERKTVKDAVEYYNGVWPSDEKSEIWHTDIITPDIAHNYQVCTREEFEADVNRLDPNNWEVLIDSPESEDKKWTHTWKGNRCRVVFTEDYRSWVKGPALDTLVQTDDLEPIKPTITKEEAWDMASEHAVSVAYIKEHNNIID